MEEKSKSQVKRDMLALQSLGEELVSLTPDQIRKIEMDQDLREAVLFAKTLKKHEARRRQMQHIGAIMRTVDSEPIRKALHEINHGRSLDAQLFRQLEKWRDALVDGNDDLLEDIALRFPDADRRHLRQLVLNARKERDGDKPPQSSRALFKYLRSIAEAR